MSLVAYENSSESEGEENSTKDVKANDSAKESVLSVCNTKDNVTITNNSLFTSLPEPRSHEVDVIEEVKDTFLYKKEVPTELPQKLKKPIKIGIPSLTQFHNDDDEDEPVNKKQKPQSKTCGLFALLPEPKSAPKSNKHLIPQVIKRNLKKIQKPKKPVLPQTDEHKSEESDGDDVEIGELPETFDDETWQTVCGRRKRVPKPLIEDQKPNTNIIELAPEPIKPYGGLDNQAFKELLGSSSKRNTNIIDIVEINEDEILPDKDVWLTKSLTDPEMAPKYVVKDPVNDTCRRKHHITYLAQQAKANEQDLKNQWAANRFNRQKTQAKYGF